MNDSRPIQAPDEFKRDANLHVKPTDNPQDETKQHGVLHDVKESVKDGVHEVMDKVKGHSEKDAGSKPDYYQKTYKNANDEHVKTF